MMQVTVKWQYSYEHVMLMMKSDVSEKSFLVIFLWSHSASVVHHL